MKRFSRLVLRSILLTTVSIFFVGIAVAQDVLTVGTGATCITGTAGATITVPIFIRDVSGTPLGVDRATLNERIQAVSFQVTPSNPGAIAVDGANRLRITYTKVGVTAGLTPLLESTTNTPTTSAYLVSYDQTADPIAFTSNMAAPGNLFVNMNVILAAGAAAGTTINITLNPSGTTTAVSNQAGTISETAAAGNLNLTLVSGCIVIPAPPTISLACPAAFTAGTTANGTVTISVAQGTATTITLSSGTTGVATVPANVVIAAGATSATFPITGVSAGTSTITATPPAGLGTAQTCTATVNAPPTTTSLACPAAFTAGTTANGTVTISAAQGTATTITLSSSNTGVATVPANVVIAAGATSATFTVTGVSAGSSTITATPPAGLGTAQTCTATVTAPATTSITPPAAGACSAGATCTGTVTISAAQGTATTITLSSSNTGVATVPASVVIPAGATSATFTITGVTQGTSTITATPPGGLGTPQTFTVTIGASLAIPALGPFGLLLLVSLLALAGYFVTKTMS